MWTVPLTPRVPTLFLLDMLSQCEVASGDGKHTSFLFVVFIPSLPTICKEVSQARLKRCPKSLPFFLSINTDAVRIEFSLPQY